MAGPRPAMPIEASAMPHCRHHTSTGFGSTIFAAMMEIS
jgi:hypothetical protein